MDEARSLPDAVIAEDRRLETEADQASLALAKLRWHWTLDETNGGRVAIRAYARQIERGEATIRQYVRGFQHYQEAVARNTPRSIADCLATAMMSSETEAAAQAVAAARGIALATAREEYPNDVRRVRQIARQRAEQKGTSVASEAPRIATSIAAPRRADQANTEEQKARETSAYVLIDRDLSEMRRRGERAIKNTIGAALGAETQDLLRDRVREVRTVLVRLERVLTGGPDETLDAELATLVEGGR